MIFSKKISFKYNKTEDKEGNIRYYPIADVVLLGKKESFETTALIDSGADISLISQEIADVLDLELGKESEAETLSGEKLKTYSSKVNILLKGKGTNIPLNGVPVDVVDASYLKKEIFDIILGRAVIFDNFRITFSQFEKIVTFEKINPKWFKY